MVVNKKNGPSKKNCVVLKKYIKSHAFPHQHSFITMQRKAALDNVCLIIDLEGYFVQKKFYCRELGWTNWQGKFGFKHYQQPFRWKTLNQLDRHTARYVYHRIHGLPFEDPPEENARHLENLKGDVLEMYQQNQSPERFLVAYKGGHVEKDLLRDLDLPAINLEHCGCPKFEKLVNVCPIQDCGHHKQARHCAMVESQAFWQWTMMPDWDTDSCL